MGLTEAQRRAVKSLLVSDVGSGRGKVARLAGQNWEECGKRVQRAETFTYMES